MFEQKEGGRTQGPHTHRGRLPRPGGGGARTALGHRRRHGARGGRRGGYTGVGTPQKSFEKTIQTSKRLYKAPTDYTKPPGKYTKTKNIIQSFQKTIRRHRMFGKTCKLLDKYKKQE